MNIVVLGGQNDSNYELDNNIKSRINELYKIIEYNQDNIIHFSGGFNEKFNMTNISHAEICKNYFLKNFNENKKINIKLHPENNNTVEEAINFGNYFKEKNYEIKIITNDWHKNRVKYLFDIVFKYHNIINYEIIGVKNVVIDNNLIIEEKEKLIQLKKNPYGLWKIWLVNNYYEKYLNLKFVKKNDLDGKIIVKMRNENNEYFFDKSKFYWDSFKEIFYQKYFSNEIPPFFIYLNSQIIGFIGCKTLETNINDIGIMFFKKYQNCGLGKISLRKFLAIYNTNKNNTNKKIIAKILKDNISSYKIFLANGFKEDTNVESIYYMIYE